MPETSATNSPKRLYTPNIEHNPLTWMGIWTPQGWRVHRKRFGRARQCTHRLTGDGVTTHFTGALFDRDLQRVAWQDDLHLNDDPFTDGGIYPADPRIEYPPGRARWAVSHTLLNYPVADHTLYTHEYTWDLSTGDLHTRFRQHVSAEETRTDSLDGMTVCVAKLPISRTIEGNRCFPLQNSAVRGVWENPQKSGENFYARRVVQRLVMHNGVYVTTPYVPVVQCHGLFAVSAEDSTEALEVAFDPQSRECTDRSVLIEKLSIPLDAPRLAMLDARPYRQVYSDVYEGPISMLGRIFGEVAPAHLSAAEARLGARFEIGKVGYAAENARDSDVRGYRGYAPQFDLNNNGVIDADDLAVIAQNIERRLRLNLYRNAYFGGDWLSTSVCMEPNHQPGTPIIADYEYGGGYDAETGVIRLLKTPGPNRPVWVEYHHDAPAAAGEEIVVHTYREESK